MSNETRELSFEELNAVSGGFHSAMIAGQRNFDAATDATRDARSTIGRVEDWLKSMSSTSAQSRDAALKA